MARWQSMRLLGKAGDPAAFRGILSCSGTVQQTSLPACVGLFPSASPSRMLLSTNRCSSRESIIPTAAVSLSPH